MKKVISIITIVITILIMCLAFTGCNPQITSDKLLLCNWPEHGSETFTYEISNKDGNAGTLIMKIENIEGGYLITRNQTMTNGDSIIGSVKFSNTAKNFAFPPIESVVTSKINGTTTTNKIVYSNSNITYYTANSDNIPADAKGQTFNHRMPYYDNMQFYTILRGATFNNKFNLSFNLFIPAEKQFCTLACTLGASDNLSYKLDGQQKMIDCQQVNIYRSQRVPGDPIKAFYAKGDITIGDKKVKQAPIRFIEPNYTYSLSNIEVA